MFATWMRVIKPGWIVPLLITSIGLLLLDSAISLGIRTLLTTPHSTSIRYLFGTPSLRDQVINSLVLNPLIGLLNLAVAVYVVGALTPAERGSLNERAFQVVRPYLLAQIVISIINIVIGEPVFALGLTTLGQNPLVDLVIAVINLAIGLYSLVASLNALAAGSGRSRLLIFGILVVIDTVSFLVVWFALGALLSVVGVHLPVPIFW
jgi:hypothetical protein